MPTSGALGVVILSFLHTVTWTIERKARPPLRGASCGAMAKMRHFILSASDNLGRCLVRNVG